MRQGGWRRWADDKSQVGVGGQTGQLRAQCEGAVTIRVVTPARARVPSSGRRRSGAGAPTHRRELPRRPCADTLFGAAAQRGTRRVPGG